MQALYEKQGRSAQFATEAERDQSVRKEIKALEKTLQQQTKLAGSCRQQVTQQAAACKAAAQVRLCDFVLSSLGGAGSGVNESQKRHITKFECKARCQKQQQTKLAGSCRQQVTQQAAACKAAAQVCLSAKPA